MNAFVCKASERNDNIGIIEDKASVKFGEAKEGSYLLDGFRSPPLEDCADS